MSGPTELEGARLKIGRAKHHLEELEFQFGVSSTAHRDAFAHESNAEGTEHVVWLKDDLGPVSPLYPLIIGDYFHNLRSALDHIAFEVNKLGAGAQFTDKLARDSEFPVFEDEAAFKRSAPRKIAGFRAKERALITDMQPYIGLDHPTRSGLLSIHDLNRFDKHRELTLLWHGWGQISINVGPNDTVDTPSVGKPLEAGTEVLRARLAEPKTKVDVNPQVSLGVLINDGRGELLSLHFLMQVANAVLRQFSDFFTV